ARGDFDAFSPRDDTLFGREDWAFLYVPEPAGIAPHGGGLRPRSFAALHRQPGGASVDYTLLGYSAAHGGVTLSMGCRVVESRSGDLGGGAWTGQLLDDCDSGEGASGGALVAETKDGPFLVAIRTGAHWDEATFPGERFPAGPPDGEIWSVDSNTNFSRAIDREMLDALARLIREIEGPETPSPGI
ncbi:MAG: hypothetical protein GWM87_11285, partial [Xanthomonadales bacterium]|nr:hypothetical protein [Xanthomonadales bacterium]NIX13455.1 hypothetical protein [Xanthomonadales bacterium]